MQKPFALPIADITAPPSGRPRLLLHSCCGPCSTAVLERLSEQFDVTLHFYNPNIQPAEEYIKRLDAQREVCRRLGIPIIEEPYDDGEFLAAAAGLEAEPEGGRRCAECFRLRLQKTAEAARAGSYDCFTTTLTVSPHKNAPLINELGRQAAERCGVPFWPSDFKKRDGYKRSIELSKEYGLYRQNYCGCLFSKR